MKATKRDKQEFEKWNARNKVSQLMSIRGDVGIVAKIGLLAALDRQEVLYLYNQELCANSHGCHCAKIHAVEKSNGLLILVVNWRHGRKLCSLKILPLRLWKSFRNLPSLCEVDLRNADAACRKAAGVRFDQLQRIALLTLRHSMGKQEQKIFQSTASASVAQHYLEGGLDDMARSYWKAWERVNVILVAF